ncbi:aminotransferase class I/II-fold pyridoxal phosphate-dependent enzyme [Streptomyces sp. NBC_00576]|uniref:aminotransferase class I/II-fold pyridoxal phosphate-dependent enzyme n=1 Tax=Streptomyces sp. NBC_00576 TaxID=2903665 RepID=UPI002E7FF884|nr:aminotransferase class I/II-fold pyridoxal phosphate-dependent enzyme [Streptomyces sp. NBC_00576]WUB68684.1 aminotransferase class I/II-fold pyridoxal phosphate-dependent enzyme [Streptomyces sp. NBC_00576]WUB77012.1 aminotransferase class I/II-fold pyridoxal phosphate-dependent enzyme [Streptomyces sp. NBC_00576]
MELSLGEFASLAQEKLDPSVWDFIEGGAGEERTLAANTAAFDRVRLRPSVLRGASDPRTATRILGRTWDAPLAVAPVAYHTLADPAGELATVRGTAAAARVPVVISTFAGRTFEEIAAEAAVPLWLQVYCMRDRSITRDLIERAANAGFEALVLTADAPHLGRRLRDLRNDFRLPAGTVPANLAGDGFAVPSAHSRTDFDPDLDWSVLDWLRSVSPLPVLVKGILTGIDAVRAAEAGADGIVVSNHGGRQLDGVPATLDVLPEVTAAIDGRLPVLLDGGVRRGQDVLAALALGADAVLLGRPVLHGLAAGGADGVTGVFSVLLEELTDAMSLAGLKTVADIGPALVGTAPPHPRRDASAAEADGHTGAEGRPGLRVADLHPSVADPVMDTMNFLNEVTLRYSEAVSFAPGRPYAEFFETEQVFRHLRRYMGHLAEQGRSSAQVRDTMFQYGPSAGLIRELIAHSLRVDEDIDVPPESIVVTVGCQEAMFLTLRALMSGPKDVLMVSSPCYVGITGAARLLDVPLAAVEESENGLSCDFLEAAVEAERARGRRPKAVYVVPDHSNPSGATMPLEARLALLDLAERLDILVLEDSPYRHVSPGTQVVSLKSLDRTRRVVHLGSYAKTVFPGARIGFAVADQPVLAPDGSTSLLADELAKIKSMITVNTSPLSQAVVAGALLESGGRVSELNALPAAHYGQAMRFTLECLAREFPVERRTRLKVSWNAPSGGFFLTLHVPFRADNAALARSAQDFGVIWTPMSYFYPQGGGHHTIRLSTSYLTHADIEKGISRLAQFIECECAGLVA